jgi:hypothetical protein
MKRTVVIPPTCFGYRISILGECSSAWLKLSILLYNNCMEPGSGNVLKYMLSLASDVGVVWFGGWFACDCTVSL